MMLAEVFGVSVFRIGLLLLTLLPTLSAQQYTFQRFSVPGQPGTIANSINNRGAIVGNSTTGQGFKRDANGVFEFPISGQLKGINDSGEIAGYYGGQDGNDHGFLLTGGVHGTRTTVDVPPGPWTLIQGINNLGDFAGYTEDINARQYHGFVSIGGVITQIDVPGADGTWVTAIARDSTVVGYYSETINGSQHVYGFVRGPKGNFLRFRVPPGFKTLPQGINNEAGVIVGSYGEGKNGLVQIHGFVYNYLADLAALDGLSANAVRTVSAQTVDYPGKHQTYIAGVNAKGVLVGYTVQGVHPVFSFTATPVP